MVDNAMGRLWRRGAPHPAAVRSPAWRGATAYGALAIAVAGGLLHYIPGPPRGDVSYGPAKTTAAFHRIILPDLAVIEAGGISDASLARIGKIHGVTQTLAMDGAAVTSGGAKVNVIGVNAQQFRSWTPLKTASNQKLWNALDAGGFVASTDVRHQLNLHKGNSYSFTGAGTLSLQFAGAARLGVAGIDVVVSNNASARLGLIHHVGALISAPGLSISKLRHDVKTALAGSAASLITLRPQHAPPLVTGGPPATSSCSRSPRPSTAPACRGPFSRPSARSRAAIAPTPGYPPRAPWARCSSCRPPGPRGGSRRSGSKGRRTSWIRSTLCRPPPATCARPAARPRRACPARSSPTTTPTGTSARYSRSPRSTSRPTADCAHPGERPPGTPRWPTARFLRHRAGAAGPGERLAGSH